MPYFFTFSIRYELKQFQIIFHLWGAELSCSEPTSVLLIIMLAAYPFSHFQIKRIASGIFHIMRWALCLSEWTPLASHNFAKQPSANHLSSVTRCCARFHQDIKYKRARGSEPATRRFKSSTSCVRLVKYFTYGLRIVNNINRDSMLPSPRRPEVSWVSGGCRGLCARTPPDCSPSGWLCRGLIGRCHRGMWPHHPVHPRRPWCHREGRESCEGAG